MNAAAPPNFVHAGICSDDDGAVLAVAAVTNGLVVLGTPTAGFDRAVHIVREGLQAGAVLVAHDTDTLLAFLADRSVSVADIIDVGGTMRALGLSDALEDVAAICGVTLASRSTPGMVAAERAVLASKLVALVNAAAEPAFERWAMSHTARMNAMGLRLDVEHARGLHRRVVARRNATLGDLARAFDVDTSALGRQDAILAFVRSEFGVSLVSLNQHDAAVIAARRADPALARFLDLRRQVEVLGRAAAKLHAIANGPARVHGHLTYFGAHTGRFSSGGVANGLNIHGLPKGDASMPELRQFRRVLIPDDGESWVSADLSTIEPRVLAFLANEKPLLERFVRNEDVYCWFSSVAFSGKTVVKGGENDHLRRMSKEAVVGLGYLMGADGFHHRLLSKGFDIDASGAKALRDTYKATFPEIARFPWRLWRAIHAAYRHRRSCSIGLVRIAVQATPTRPDEVTLCFEIPSGRLLRYHAVRTTQSLRPDGRRSTSLWFAERFGPASDAAAPDPSADDEADDHPPARHELRAFSDGVLRRQLTPPMLIENIVQAVARDVMVALAAEIDAEPELKVRFHVHDEIVAAAAACRCPDAVHTIDCPWLRGIAKLEALMSRVPPSLPRLAGLPIAAEVNREVRTSYAP